MNIWQPGLTLEQIEKVAIMQAFKFYQGNKTHTANSLGIAIRTLDAKLEKYELEKAADEQRYAEKLRLEKEAIRRAQQGTANILPEGRVSVQSIDEITAEHEMPMPERKEIQKMPPRSATTSDRKQAR